MRQAHRSIGQERYPHGQREEHRELPAASGNRQEHHHPHEDQALVAGHPEEPRQPQQRHQVCLARRPLQDARRAIHKEQGQEHVQRVLHAGEHQGRQGRHKDERQEGGRDPRAGEPLPLQDAIGYGQRCAAA